MRRHRFWIGFALLVTVVVMAGLAFNLWRSLSLRQPWVHVPGPCVDGAVLTVVGDECGGRGTTFDRDQIYAPSLIKDIATETVPCGEWPVGTTCYRLWYVGTVGEERRIGYSLSADGLNWQRVPGPEAGGSVLAAGPLNSFDSGGVSIPVVLKDNGMFRMWYIGLNSDNHPNGVGVARSTDGLHWVRESSTPVLRESGMDGAFDQDELPTLTVVKDLATVEAPCAETALGQDCYRMWYEGVRYAPDYKFSVGYAVSADGLHWTRVIGKEAGGATLSAGWPRTYDARSVGVPHLLKDGALYRLWHEAWAHDGAFGLGYATSTDGVAWIRPSPLTPAFTGADDPGMFTPDDVWATRVLKEGVQYRMWYTISSRPNARRIAVAKMTPGAPFKTMALRREGQTFVLSFESAQAAPAGGSVLVTLPAGWKAQPETLSGFGSEARAAWEPNAVTDAEAQGVARGALLLRLKSTVAPGLKEVRFSIVESSAAFTTPAVLYLQTFSANEVLEYGSVVLTLP
ncbi:MAG: hypothetical protein ACT4QE_07940 [Anaerolineales bacterium]